MCWYSWPTLHTSHDLTNREYLKYLKIKKDDGANEVGPGYLKSDKYCSSSTGTSSCLGGNAFDGNNPLTNTGREKGFLGINMNGNLAVGGTIKMFSCEGGSGGHPRC